MAFMLMREGADVRRLTDLLWSYQLSQGAAASLYGWGSTLCSSNITAVMGFRSGAQGRCIRPLPVGVNGQTITACQCTTAIESLHIMHAMRLHRSVEQRSCSYQTLCASLNLQM